MVMELVELAVDQQQFVSLSASTVLYISSLFLTYDLVSDVLLGIEALSLYKEAEQNLDYYNCTPPSEDYCSCDHDGLMVVDPEWTTWMGIDLSESGAVVEGNCTLSPRGKARWTQFVGEGILRGSCFDHYDVGKCWFFKENIFQGDGLTISGHYFSKVFPEYVREGGELSGQGVLNMCGCIGTSASPFQVGNRDSSLTIARAIFALVIMASIREIVRVGIIIYNIIFTRPFDKVRYPRWIAESPFMLLLRIFHPEKWQDMAILKTNSRFEDSYGMIVNMFTEDILSISLDIAILADPIASGSARGQTISGLAIASLVASCLMLCYNACVIHRLNSAPNGNSSNRLSPNRRKWLSPHNLMLLSVGLTLIECCAFVILAQSYKDVDIIFTAAAILFFYTVIQEFIRSMFVFVNLFRRATNIICPGMVLESPASLLLSILKPSLFGELVEVFINDCKMARNRILVNILTQDVPFMVIATAFLLTFDADLIDSTYSKKAHPAAIVVLVASLSALILDGYRLCLLKKQAQRSLPTTQTPVSTVPQIGGVAPVEKDSATRKMKKQDGKDTEEEEADEANSRKSLDGDLKRANESPDTCPLPKQSKGVPDLVEETHQMPGGERRWWWESIDWPLWHSGNKERKNKARERPHESMDVDCSLS